MSTPAAENTPAAPPPAAAPAAPAAPEQVSIDTLSYQDYKAARAAGKDTVEAPAAPAAPAASTPAAPDANQGDPDDDASEAGRTLAGKKKSLQGRIDELTRERHQSAQEAQRHAAEAAELRARLARLEGGQPPAAPGQQQPPAAGDAPAKPELEKFATYEEYVEALADWKAQERIRTVLEQQAEVAARSARQQRETQVQESARKAFSDFDTVIDAFAGAGHQFAPAAVGAILEHPDGHKLAYALAKDPALNQVIASAQSPAMALLEVGRVLASVATTPAPAAPAAPATPPPVSSAPPPVAPLAASGPVNTKPLDQVDMAEYKRRRQAGEQ